MIDHLRSMRRAHMEGFGGLTLGVATDEDLIAL